jgi:hypothetical protein
MTFLIMGAVAAVVAFLCAGNLTTRIMAAVLGFLFGWIVSWLSLPVQAWGFAASIWIAVVIPAGIGFGIGLAGNKWGAAQKAGLGIMLGSAVLSMIIPAFSLPIFGNAQEYHAVIGSVSESSFAEDVSPIDIRYPRAVDLTQAVIGAEGRRAEDQSLGGRVVIGNMNIQQVNGTVHLLTGAEGKYTVQTVDMREGFWWVGPLNHNGFRRWSGGDVIPPFSGTTTPGYVMTSAMDETQSYMVKGVCELASDSAKGTVTVDGYVCEEISLRYMNENAYFGDYLMRHLYNNGYKNIGLTDASFEIDDTGRPFWVVTTYKRAVGSFGGRKATGVVVVDPQTGDISPYSVADAPRWVDRIQPEEFVREQLTWWGQFSGTWWNGTFGQQINVIEPTLGTRLIRAADSNMYWYTDLKLSSSENDRASVGFVLVNARTGEARQYRPQGGGYTVASVKTAIENHPDNIKNFRAGSLILYNVSGVPTYFAPLVGTDGRIQGYAFADYQTASVVGLGDTPRKALRSYANALAKEPGTAGMIDLVEAEELLAVVTQVASEGLKEGTVYYLRIEGAEELEFFGGSESFVELKWVRVGDTVRLRYSVAEDPNMKQTSVPILEMDRMGDALQGE